MSLLTVYDFEVPGIARTSGSHAVTRAGRIRHAGTYTKAWMDTVSWTFKMIYGKPIVDRTPRRLICLFKFGRKTEHFGTGRNAGKLRPSAPEYHFQMPDLDKLVRAVQDALSGLAYYDDANICYIAARKEWAAIGEGPGVRIYVTEIEGQLPPWYQDPAAEYPLFLTTH